MCYQRPYVLPSTARTKRDFSTRFSWCDRERIGASCESSSETVFHGGGVEWRRWVSEDRERQLLFTWLWRWLPLNLSKRQSTTKNSFFRTPFTRTITRTIRTIQTTVYFCTNYCITDAQSFTSYDFRPKLFFTIFGFWCFGYSRMTI